MVTFLTAGETRILLADATGPLLASERDALDLISEAYGLEIDVIAIPAARLAPEFFRLRSGLAGAILQKLRNYGFKVAIVGDIADHTAKSTALRDFVLESNRSRQVVFVAVVDAIVSAIG